MYNSEYDWQYKTVNDGETSQGIENGQVAWTKGKMLGGSSGINALVYVTGNDHDYQRWYDAGNKEWSVDEVRRCFKKAESLQNQDMLRDPTISTRYGHNGPLTVNQFNNTYRSYTDKILESWGELGFENTRDLIVDNYMGAGILPATAFNGVRSSTFKTYLKQAEKRSNLKVVKQAFVTKILINENFIAYGVEVKEYGLKKTYLATREVILSAGSISSPQILMLSGVGPQEHLETHNVECLVNSPMVGQNLQDHALMPVTIYGDKPGAITLVDVLKHIKDYLLYRKGFLAQSSVVTDAGLFFSTLENANYPNSQSHVTVVNKNFPLMNFNLKATFGYNDTVLKSITDLNQKYALYFFEYILLHPYSRGNVSLASNDPTDLPLIYANYFEDPRDLEIAVKAIKTLTKILNTPYFRSINAFLGRMNVPACNSLELDSEAYWKCICTNLVTSIFHPVGTCQMGPSINTSVVDSRLRVHGVKRLRVIDAGVMPTTTSGNTNGPTIMVAEKGVELIKEDYL
ncbi:unnamed protein product [Chrysodeixis includens]|uniref:Glucose-methanol-choline oxidoreductase N-terminal domain-containing protein n=1 Tax=Chrysodeixis includens TaxID=689277 RepID=A0A9N8KWD8_CHRIL|nr:unnamed protein product [Chrysodeixis includens]